MEGHKTEMAQPEFLRPHTFRTQGDRNKVKEQRNFSSDGIKLTGDSHITFTKLLIST